MIKQLKKKFEQFFPYKKRKAIEDWDFIMVFQEYYRQQVEMILESVKCQDDMEWTVVHHKQAKKCLFMLKFSEKVVEDMAHELKILKKKDKKSYKMSLRDINSTIYTMGQNHPTNAYNYLCFIRSRMYPKNREIYEQEQYSAFNKYKKHKYFKEANGELFTEEEKLRGKYHFLLTYEENISSTLKIQFSKATRLPFVQLMKHPGFEELVPIQKVSQHRPLILHSLKDYLGPNLDCYFDFVSFMQKWLWFPLVVGLITVGINSYFQFTADNSPVDFLYAWAVMIWSILFITRWEEVQNWMKVKETPGSSQIWSEHQELVSKRGMEKHISSVTGQVEYFLPLKERILLHLASNAAFLAITILTMIFMVLSLNLRGFIDPEHKLFYSDTLSKLADEGGIFDVNTSWNQIPNIFHVLITNGFDEMVYRPFAIKLAKFERHNTRKGYQNSIIIKYFIYEFLITFADLFYIAFVRFDIVGLRQQLFSLFFIDIIRRLVAESLVPWLKKTYRSHTLKKNYEVQKHLTYEEELEKGAILEVEKEPYEQFDDYLEIITNLGYLVMISSCFPLAPLLILIAHQVQIFQDRYKIVHIFKRKLPQNYVGMGRWKNIIVFMCYLSIITNIMLFAFSSEQVASIFPKMFEGGKDLIYGNTDFQTILGGAATGIFQKVADVADTNNDNVTSMADGWYMMQNLFQRNQDITAEMDLPQNLAEDSQEPIMLEQFRPPNKESQTTFIAVLFVIEHFFLFLFIVIRDLLKKRKTEADIFLERRQYKRKIKKNLPKDILALVTGGMLINKLFQEKEEEGGTNLLTKIISDLSGKKEEEIPQKHVQKLVEQPQNMSGDDFLMRKSEDKSQSEEVRKELLAGLKEEEKPKLD